MSKVAIKTARRGGERRNRTRALRRELLAKFEPKGIRDEQIDVLAWCASRFYDSDDERLALTEYEEDEEQRTVEAIDITRGLMVLKKTASVKASGEWLSMTVHEVDRSYVTLDPNWVEGLLKNVPGRYEVLGTSDTYNRGEFRVRHVAVKGKAVMIVYATAGEYAENDADATVEISLAFAQDEAEARKLALGRVRKASEMVLADLKDRVLAYTDGEPRARLLADIRTLLDKIERGDEVARE